MMKQTLHCPNCKSEEISKKGRTRRGKQNHKCRECGRQFVEEPQWQPKDVEKRALMNKLLLERISLAGIARVLNLSESWLQAYVNKHYQAVPRQVEVMPKPKGKLMVQMDELWSFVDNKGNKQWVWLAIDAKTREIIGCQIGDRSQASAQLLWDSLPSVYRQCAKLYTDFWAAYQAVLPSKRHTAVAKETGLTSLIERLNNTLRQRVSRLVRKTLSFSKKLENHISAIWNFIHDYNLTIRSAILNNQSHPLFSPSFT
jgi:insertion element IS1 protein InsB